MLLRKLAPALRLPCLAVLLAAQAASAESPLPIVRIYPKYLAPPLPSNPAIVAHASRGYRIDATQVVLRGSMGEEIPSTITADADERGGVLVTPSAPLPEGSYTLATGSESYTVSVAGGPDTTPPSAISEPTVMVARSGKDSIGDVSIEFPSPTDDRTPRGELGYDIWIGSADTEPDLNSKPTMMGAPSAILSNGKLQVSLAPGGICVAALPSHGSGRFNVRLRARDAAGNLGPATETLQVQVNEVPECSGPNDESKGCSAAPLLAPVAWVAVALWLSRRRQCAGT